MFVSRAQREAVKAEIESEQAEIEALMDEAEREQRDQPARRQHGATGQAGRGVVWSVGRDESSASLVRILVSPTRLG